MLQIALALVGYTERIFTRSQLDGPREKSSVVEHQPDKDEAS